jgi:hypothetical protein
MARDTPPAHRRGAPATTARTASPIPRVWPALTPEIQGQLAQQLARLLRPMRTRPPTPLRKEAGDADHAGRR